MAVDALKTALEAQAKLVKAQEELLQLKSLQGAQPGPSRAGTAAAIPPDEMEPIYQRGEGRLRKDLLPGELGGQVGFHKMDDVPDIVARRIKEGAYVEFGDLLASPDQRCVVSHPQAEAEGVTLNWEAKPKKVESQAQWWRAWDLYADAYVASFPSAARDLIRYAAFIRTLMEKKTGA